MRVVAYQVRDVGKTADYFRKKARKLIKTECYVEQHPGLVRYRFLRDIDEKELEKLDNFMKECCDGERI